MTLAIEAPTDAQLDYIRMLCYQTGHRLPDVIHSKQEGGEIIDALKDGTYDASRYDWPDEAA